MTRSKDPDEIPSIVFARGPARDSRVTQPSSPWTMTLGVAGLAVLAVGVFVSLSQARTSRSADSATRPAIATVVAQAAPIPASPAQPEFPAARAQIIAPIAPPQPQAPDPHLRAPAMVVDLGDPGAGPQAAQQLAQAGGTAAVAPQLSADERFAARVSSGSADTARATQLRDLTRIVPQGTTIPAVMETAVDSDLPGSVRAVVSRDVRSFDGSLILIPRGSKLIGQYRSAAAIGQTRAFIVWTRLLTPSGVSVDIGSPATDQLGRGGLAGKVDTHFAARFGGSILLTVLSAGAERAARGDGGGGSNTLIIGAPVQAGQMAAETALQKQIDIPVTIRVAQGAPVQVSVARDLDFSGVVAAGR